MYNARKYDLNRQPGYEDRRYYLAHYIQAQITAGRATIEGLDALGIIDQAGKVDFETLSDFDALKSVKSSRIGGGVGGYTQAQRPPGVYTCVDVCMLKKVKQFVEIPITIWVIIALRRLFNDPIDVMLGLEYLPHLPGGSQTIRNLRRISKKGLADRTGLTAHSISIVDYFSRWAYDNKAGKIETPAIWVLEQLVKNKVTWDTLLKMRNSLESNIDDILGICYNE